MSLTAAWLILIFLAGSEPAICSEQSRVAQWTCARVLKSRHPSPEKGGVLESSLQKLEQRNFTESAPIDDAFGMSFNTGNLQGSASGPSRSVDGLRLLAGGLSQESGLAAGLEFGRSEFWRRRVNFSVSGRWSIQKYQKYMFEIGVPRTFHSRLFMDFRAVHRNYPRQDFFGIGPDSDDSKRSTFAFDGTELGSTIGFRLSRGLQLRASGGFLHSKTGSRKDAALPSVEQLFHPSEAPALNEQLKYRYFGASLNFDYRDDPVNPVSGGFYRIASMSFHDQDLKQFSFRRYSIELRQYVPVFGPQRVLAVRAMTSLTDAKGDNEIPFSMMAALGGSESLRGFSDARFRDRNFVLLNTEYRWAVFTQLDAVLFADAGKVFSRAGQLGFNRLETSYGFGARVKSPNGPLFRVEFGFSNENRRFHFLFSPAF